MTTDSKARNSDLDTLTASPEERSQTLKGPYVELTWGAWCTQSIVVFIFAGCHKTSQPPCRAGN
eukprot:831176-Pyramimonas_sp.AAC.1